MKVIVTWFIYLNHFTFSLSRIDNYMQKHQKVQNIPGQTKILLINTMNFKTDLKFIFAII